MECVIICVNFRHVFVKQCCLIGPVCRSKASSAFFIHFCKNWRETIVRCLSQCFEPNKTFVAKQQKMNFPKLVGIRVDEG